MRHFTRTTLLQSAALLGIAGSASTAIAQTAPSPTAQYIPPKPHAGLEEVIVTAQRRQTRLQKTPVAVTSLNTKALESKGVTSLLDLGSAVPNLTVSSRATFGATSGGFTIRGIGTDATGSSPAVGIYIDDVYYPSAVGNLLGLFDVSRIEVLRGPQGTLFGRNTIAGAIQYVGNRPTDKFGGYVETTLGTYGRREVEAALNVPITDKLVIRVAGEVNDVGGFVTDPVAHVDRGADRTSFAKFQLHWTPTDAITFDLRADVLHDAQNGRAIAIVDGPDGAQPNLNSTFPTIAKSLGVSLAGFGPGLVSKPGSYSFAGFGSPDYLNYDYHGISGVFSWAVTDNLTLKSISAYSYDNSQADADLSNSPYSLINANTEKTTDSLFTQEVQAAGNLFDDRLNYTLGGYYYDNTTPVIGKYTTFGGYGQGFFPDGLLNSQTGGDYSLHDVSKALYGQVRYIIIPKLNFTAGLRYSEETIDGTYLNTTTSLPPQVIGFGPHGPILKNGLITTAVPAYAPESASYTNLSPSFGLDYQATPDILIYAKASRGFRAGGFNVSVGYPGAFESFGPEDAWTYETGVRSEFLGHRLRFNPTIFQTEWTGIQFNALQPTATGVATVTKNAGSAEIRGFEAESEYVVMEGLNLNGSLSWLEGHYDRIDPGIDVSAGEALQHAPKWKFDLGATYVLPVGSYGTLTTTADYNWTAKQRSAVTDSDYIEQPSYGLVNAQLVFTPSRGKWSITAYGINLANKYYYIGGVNGSTAYKSPGVVDGQGAFGITEADLGRPREVGVKLKYRF